MRVVTSLSLILLAFFVAGCGPQKKPQEIRILCGNSMATPAQTVVEMFKAQQHAEVAMDLGGSETLLPRVLTGAPADIFICHDPFEEKVKAGGFWSGSASVGVLKPVLLVKPGNPLHITSTLGLTNTNVRLGIGDPEYSTCGAMFVEMLSGKGLKDSVLKQVKVQTRTHAELANGLILGSLDAVVVWNFVSKLYSNKVELVATSDTYKPVNVTVLGLKQTSNPKLRDAFLELCRGDSVRKIFAENGYGQ